MMETVYMYMRSYEQEKLLVICSFAEHEVEYTIPKQLSGEKGEMVLCNYSDSDPELCRLRAFETRILYFTGERKRL